MDLGPTKKKERKILIGRRRTSKKGFFVVDSVTAL